MKSPSLFLVLLVGLLAVSTFAQSSHRRRPGPKGGQNKYSNPRFLKENKNAGDAASAAEFVQMRSCAVTIYHDEGTHKEPEPEKIIDVYVPLRICIPYSLGNGETAWNYFAPSGIGLGVVECTQAPGSTTPKPSLNLLRHKKYIRNWNVCDKIFGSWPAGGYMPIMKVSGAPKRPGCQSQSIQGVNGAAVFICPPENGRPRAM